MPRNLNEIVRLWIRLLTGLIIVIYHDDDNWIISLYECLIITSTCKQLQTGKPLIMIIWLVDGRIMVISKKLVHQIISHWPILPRHGLLWLAAHPHPAGPAPYDLGAVAHLLQPAAGPLHPVRELAAGRGAGQQLAGGGRPQQDLARAAGLPPPQQLSHPGGREGGREGRRREG